MVCRNHDIPETDNKIMCVRTCFSLCNKIEEARRRAKRQRRDETRRGETRRNVTRRGETRRGEMSRDETRRDETRRTDRQTVETVRARAASQPASLPACLWESFSTCSTPSRPCRASNSTDRSILLLLRATSYPKPCTLSLLGHFTTYSPPPGVPTFHVAIGYSETL